MNEELENASARAHISRLEAMKLQMQQQVEVLFGNQLDTVDKAMRDVYEDGYYRTAYEIQKGVSVGTSLARLDTRKIDKVIYQPWAQDGSDFSSRIWKNKDALVQQLNTTLTQNIIRGEDPQKAINAISERLNVSKRAAGRLVMTEEAAFSSSAQKDCFEMLGVEKYEIVVTLDDATCDECAPMDGMVFKMSEYEPGSTAPPFHCYCRCTTVPHFDDDFGSVGERAAKDENGKTFYVPADMTYKEWKNAYVDQKKNIEKSENTDTLKSVNDLIEDPHKFGDYTPEILKSLLEEQGNVVKPLGRGSLKGIAFEEGGGFKINFGGNGLLQYHPATNSHHGGAYYKISTAEGGTKRYDLNGNEKKE